MDREAWHAAIHGFADSQTWLSNWTELSIIEHILPNLQSMFWHLKIYWKGKFKIFSPTSLFFQPDSRVGRVLEHRGTSSWRWQVKQYVCECVWGHGCLIVVYKIKYRYRPSFGPWKGSAFLQQMATLAGILLRWDWCPDHSGYSGASLPANGPDPATATGTLLSLVSSWRGQLARVPQPVRTLLTSLAFPLSFLSLTLSILPCFSSPPVLDAGIWSKGPQPELRIGDWSPPLGRELEFWFWFLVGPSSSPPFSGGPGKRPIMPGYL